MPMIDLEVQKCPMNVQTISFSGMTGQESTDIPLKDVEAAVFIREVHDENLNHDLETEVIHLQKWPKNLPILQNLEKTHAIQKSDAGLWFKGDALVIVGNDNLKKGVTELFHDSLTTGHPRIAKTIEMVTKYYWWPEMTTFITQYIKGCAPCQMNKVNTHPK